MTEKLREEIENKLLYIQNNYNNTYITYILLSKDTITGHKQQLVCIYKSKLSLITKVDRDIWFLILRRDDKKINCSISIDENMISNIEIKQQDDKYFATIVCEVIYNDYY